MQLIRDADLHNGDALDLEEEVDKLYEILHGGADDRKRAAFKSGNVKKAPTKNLSSRKRKEMSRFHDRYAEETGKPNVENNEEEEYDPILDEYDTEDSFIDDSGLEKEFLHTPLKKRQKTVRRNDSDSSRSQDYHHAGAAGAARAAGTLEDTPSEKGNDDDSTADLERKHDLKAKLYRTFAKACMTEEEEKVKKLFKATKGMLIELYKKDKRPNNLMYAKLRDFENKVKKARKEKKRVDAESARTMICFDPKDANSKTAEPKDSSIIANNEGSQTRN